MSNTGTAYFGLRCSRDEFDQVATMRVEGVSISAIARITGRSRSTIVRWLERAAESAKHCVQFATLAPPDTGAVKRVLTQAATRIIDFVKVRQATQPADDEDTVVDPSLGRVLRRPLSAA